MATKCLRLTDEDLSRLGKQGALEWAWRKMPVLQRIRTEWEESHPLKGVKIAACLHISAKTANLARVLKIGGAGSGTLCIQSIKAPRMTSQQPSMWSMMSPTFARRGVDNDSYYSQINAAWTTKHGAELTIDDGADLVQSFIKNAQNSKTSDWGHKGRDHHRVWSGCRAMARMGALKYPLIAC